MPISCLCVQLKSSQLEHLLLVVICCFQAKPSDISQRHRFPFDRVFAPSAGQDTVFEEVNEFVQSSLDGYNVCLFSYGQTGKLLNANGILNVCSSLKHCLYQLELFHSYKVRGRLIQCRGKERELCVV